MGKAIRTVLAIAALALASCAETHSEEAPLRPLPPGVDGYQCYRRQDVAGGFAYAEGYPDYRGGIASLTMAWERRGPDSYSPEIKIFWTSGPNAIAPPGWVTVSYVRRELAPEGTWIYLRLSSGEFIGQEFIVPRYWRDWRRLPPGSSSGFGGFVSSNAPEFKEALTRAAWADLDLVEPGGAVLAHERIDLSGLQEALVVMRRLGAEVEAAVADYEHRCAAGHLEF